MLLPVAYLLQQHVYLFVYVGGAVIEYAEVGESAFVFLIHLVLHARFYLDWCGMVALACSLDSYVSWCVYFDGDADGGGKA